MTHFFRNLYTNYGALKLLIYHVKYFLVNNEIQYVIIDRMLQYKTTIDILHGKT